MINKFVFSLVLIVVATASAFGTQLAISTRAESATALAVKADRLLPSNCKTAIWPNIPDRCLGFVQYRYVRVLAFGG
jgi:hypothetical protein